MSRRLILVALWVASLVTVGTLAHAQNRRTVPVPSPFVLTGADIGFRVEGHVGDAATGRLVVRENGQWIPALATSESLRLARDY